jgi:repressor of nif and glnA expression
MANIYNVRICRRKLNYDLKAMEEMGWIRRIRRHKRTFRGIEFNSTLYLLTRKIYRFVQRALSWARKKPIFSRVQEMHNIYPSYEGEDCIDRSELEERRKTGLKYIKQFLLSLNEKEQAKNTPQSHHTHNPKKA